MHQDWEPADETEAAMLSALEERDGAAYAQLLSSAPLYVPVEPDGDAPWPPSLPRPTPDLVLLFTSPAALDHVLGGVVDRYERTDLATLRRTHPAHARLVVDPALPIGAFLQLDELDDLVADGPELADGKIDDALAEIRAACLAELRGDVRALARLTPGNALEKQLRAAGSELDPDRFLLTLAHARVVVPLSRPAGRDEHVGEPGFPWRVLGDAPPIIPVFSSERMLDVAAPAGLPRVTVPFEDVLPHWPGPRHVLCCAPGTGIELTLAAETVHELAAALGDEACGTPAEPEPLPDTSDAPPAVPVAQDAAAPVGTRPWLVPLLVLGIVAAVALVAWQVTHTVLGTAVGGLVALAVAGSAAAFATTARRRP
jgi:hypothetical protein